MCSPVVVGPYHMGQLKLKHGSHRRIDVGQLQCAFEKQDGLGRNISRSMELTVHEKGNGEIAMIRAVSFFLNRESALEMALSYLELFFVHQSSAETRQRQGRAMPFGPEIFFANGQGSFVRGFGFVMAFQPGQCVGLIDECCGHFGIIGLKDLLVDGQCSIEVTFGLFISAHF